MSLEAQDLLAIRQIIREVIEAELEPVHNELAALRNDIKEIYDILERNGIKTV